MSNLGNKQIMAENIKYYMREKDVRPTDICHTLNFPMPTFSDWINAKTYPRIDKIELMANYFGISKSDLVEERTSAKSSSSAYTINVLGRVAAGIPLNAVEEIIDTEEIPEKMARTGEFFGLKIKGHSMEPRICDGDVVIVRQQADVEDGDIAIVLVNGDEGTCKRIKRYQDSLALLPLNPTYEPMVYTKKQVADLPVTIIGKVVELRGKF